MPRRFVRKCTVGSISLILWSFILYLILNERFHPDIITIKYRVHLNLINFIFEQYDGDLNSFLADKTRSLRKGLLSVNGVGPETADSILLYAADRPVFVVDAYTHRILNRHGMTEVQSTYQELQELFMDNLPDDASLFNEFHAFFPSFINSLKPEISKKVTNVSPSKSFKGIITNLHPI